MKKEGINSATHVEAQDRIPFVHERGVVHPEMLALEALKDTPERSVVVASLSPDRQPRLSIEEADEELRHGMGIALSGLLGPLLCIVSAAALASLFGFSVLPTFLVHFGWGFLFGKIWRAQWVQRFLITRLGFQAVFGVSVAFWIKTVVENAGLFLGFDLLSGAVGFVAGLINLTVRNKGT